jgi:hypothetical protein
MPKLRKRTQGQKKQTSNRNTQVSRRTRRPRNSKLKNQSSGLVLLTQDIPKSDMSLRGNITNNNIGRIHHFTRVTALTYQTFTTGSHLGFSVNFAELSEIADISNLFDEYRINSVTWTLMPVINTVDASETLASPTTSDPGVLQFVVDFDDDDTPTSETTLQQYESYRRMPFKGPSITSTITPAISVPVFQSTIATGYRPKRLQWIDLRYPAIPHYGWKYWFKSSTADPLQTYPYYQQFTFHFSCRRVR